MPSKHVVKLLAPESYYHIYNRGVNKQDIFKDAADYATFLNIFKRHLSIKPVKDPYGREFAHLREQVELLAFCLMPNHFHLLVLNLEETGIVELMQRTMTAYSGYFNKRHRRVGGLFQGTYKASLIQADAYLWHISRYIHLNPQDIGQSYKTYPYSSYPYYINGKCPEWLQPDRILALHNDESQSYKNFVDDYKERRKELKEIEHLLADK